MHRTTPATVIALLAAAPAGAAVVVDQVVAVEDAGSPLGRYRIVFTTEAPLPPATDTYPGVGFYLGDQPVRFSPMARATTSHFGYFDTLPAENQRLQARVLGESAGAEVTVNAGAMLARSRPGPGEPEATHIRRSRGDVDLWEAWTASDVAFVGVLLREDQDPEQDGTWRLFFRPQQVLRGADRGALPDLVVLHIDGRADWNELGGRYMVFARAAEAGIDSAPAAHTEVRLWWPEHDDVQELLAGRALLGALPDPARLGALLLEGLASPAAEVRYTAASQLLRSGAALPESLREQARRTAQARLKAEPSPAVQQALRGLLSGSAP